MAIPTKAEIEENLDYALEAEKKNVRILFSPTQIDTGNLFEVCDVYSNVRDQQYESIVIVESHNRILDKKLAMSSHDSYTTDLGSVEVNDKLRNEFCDEEDDFFISDDGFNDDMSLFHQLRILQAAIKDFNVVSLQIGDYDPAIIRELAYVLSELLSTRNILLIVCCDLPVGNQIELQSLRDMIEDNNESGLLHYLSSNDKNIKGARAFMSGVMVAREWDLEIELFESDSSESITGYAARKLVV